MYEKLYEPLPDTAAYLERLGLEPPRELNREYLDGLVYAHQCRIPFENLDVYAFHRPISLGIADLFQKIVMNKRGGYCFEMNALFTALLNALGYHAWACMCRILRSKDYIPPVMHRGVLVELDGQLYFCDVGYGTNAGFLRNKIRLAGKGSEGIYSPRLAAALRAKTTTAAPARGCPSPRPPASLPCSR